MKLSKRILAVVLAVAMVLTAVAVGASAAAIPTHLKLKLDVEAYDSATDTYTALDNYKVNQGDIIAVSFSLGADRNIGEGQVLIAYDNTVFSPIKKNGAAYTYAFYAAAGATSKANTTSAALQKWINPFWNDMDNLGPVMYPTSLGPDPDGYNIGAIAYDGVTEITEAAPIDWYTDSINFSSTSNVVCKKLSEWQATYPKAWQETGPATPYLNPTNATQGEANRVACLQDQYEKYNCYRINYEQNSAAELNYGGGYLPVPSINNKVFTFFLKVKDDAAFGSTSIFIPEDDIKTVENNGTNKNIYFMTYDNYTVASSTDTDAFSGKIFDLTEISRNITVVDPNGGGSTEADKTALQAAIDQTPAYAAAYYTEATWTAYTNALGTANSVNGDTTATQEAVDAATTALNAAFGALALQPLCSYTALDAAINAAPAKAQSYYTADSWSAYTSAEAAAQAVDRNLINDRDGANQATITAATTALTTAYNGLTLRGLCSYTALNTALALTPAKAQSYYTATSWQAYASAKTTAQAVDKNLINDSEGVNQATVTNAANALTTAYGALALREVCSYTALDAAIATSVNAESTYTAASWQAYETALAAAQAVERNMINDANGINQGIIDTAKNDLLTAIGNLETIGNCNYDNLTAALALTPAKAAAYYTEATWNAYTNAKTAAQAIAPNLPATGTNQADINAAATALTNAFNALALQPGCSYTALDAAIGQTPTYAEAYYTSASWGAFAAALASAQSIDRTLINDRDGANQATITAATNALTTAYGALTLRGACSYTALDAAIATSVNAESTYTAASWQAYQTALAAAQAVERNMINDANGTNQGIVDAAKNNLLTAIGNLETLGGCDYTALDAAIALAPAKAAAYYTEATWNAYTSAKTAAQAIARNLLDTGSNQADINAAATALTTAYGALALQPVCSYTALDAAINAAPAKAQSYYTADSWSAYTTAKAAAQAVDRTLINDRDGANQATITEATTALTTAYGALTLREVCSYAALDTALALTPALTQGGYTTDSWNDYQVAKAAANLVDRSLINDSEGINQAAIDAAAAALTTAFNALEESSASITEVAQDTAKYYSVGYRDYDFTINGRAEKIQLIDGAGATRTYDRYHPNVSIVSYDDAGEICDPVLDEVAYEIWTINSRLPAGSYTAIGKFNRVWELQGRLFSVVFDQYIPTSEAFVAKVSGSEDAATAELTIEKNAYAEFSLATGKGDVEKVQLVFVGGNTSTYGRANCVEGETTDQWTITRRIYSSEAGTATVRVKCRGVWIDTGLTITIAFAE